VARVSSDTPLKTIVFAAAGLAWASAWGADVVVEVCSNPRPASRSLFFYLKKTKSTRAFAEARVDLRLLTYAGIPK